MLYGQRAYGLGGVRVASDGARINTLGEQLASATKGQVETRGATITDSKEQVETRGATITDSKVQVETLGAEVRGSKGQVAQKVWNFDNGERWVPGYCWKNAPPKSKCNIIDKEVECKTYMPTVSGDARSADGPVAVSAGTRVEATPHCLQGSGQHDDQHGKSVIN